jgi:hypothetical protein
MIHSVREEGVAESCHSDQISRIRMLAGPVMGDETPRANPAASQNYLTRFFGGPPLSVLFRLLLLSIVVGVILEVMGLDPLNIFQSLRALWQRVWDMGFEAVRWLARYLALGAAVVIPIWLVVRLVRTPQGR